MIQIGFVLLGDPSAWLGGLNYFRSLVGALGTTDGEAITSVLLTERRHAKAWGAHFPGARVAPTRLLERGSPAWALRKGIQVLSGRDLLFQRHLRALGVACLSHSAPLGSGSSLPVLGWIPDFQHLHLPDCFSAEEAAARTAAYRTICRHCDRVIVSSQDAAKDLVAFHPGAAERVRVLHFVPDTPGAETLPTLARLQQTYGFTGPYFHLPNQFWKHKNHTVVIEALRILRAAGRPALVLATGTPQDYRHPGHFEALLAQARSAGVEQDFRVLGVVPYLDMLGLMRASTALLNPSRFEGWSTTVEEARRLGVPALLSDLPVHREQAIPRARYFPPDDPEALAQGLLESADASAERSPAAGDAGAFRAFGEAYRRIVQDLIQRGR